MVNILLLLRDNAHPPVNSDGRFPQTASINAAVLGGGQRIFLTRAMAVMSNDTHLARIRDHSVK